MQGVRIDLAQQVIAGDEGESEQQKGEGQGEGLAVGTELLQQALHGGVRGSGWSFWSGGVGAHLAPHGMCATDYGRCGEFQAPCISIFSRGELRSFFRRNEKSHSIEWLFRIGCGSWI
ncbi:hypothetical protein D9M71_426620 [compost metagenome]